MIKSIKIIGWFSILEIETKTLFIAKSDKLVEVECLDLFPNLIYFLD